MSIVFLIVFVVVWAIDVAGNWLILRKAGEAVLKALIPIYSTYVQYKLFWSIKPFYIWLAMVILDVYKRQGKNYEPGLYLLIAGKNRFPARSVSGGRRYGRPSGWRLRFPICSGKSGDLHK